MKHDIVAAGTAQGADLRVEVVDTQAGFAALKEAWQALEQRDPEGTVFLSWDWLREAFTDQLYRWSVLVVRDGGGAVVCLVPLKYRVHWSGSQQEFQTQLQAGAVCCGANIPDFSARPNVRRRGWRPRHAIWPRCPGSRCRCAMSPSRSAAASLPMRWRRRGLLCAICPI
ncbi:hypothetical protein ACFQFQ_15685 [Sulfitobacter porphyrae]|uniref:Uncharacterized protein n=1 Tax=Sulfitobacter porphyrae TaxID=1246864 RepID=A0ABW2B4E6_9RHOB